MIVGVGIRQEGLQIVKLAQLWATHLIDAGFRQVAQRAPATRQSLTPHQFLSRIHDREILTLVATLGFHQMQSESNDLCAGTSQQQSIAFLATVIESFRNATLDHPGNQPSVFQAIKVRLTF